MKLEDFNSREEATAYVDKIKKESNEKLDNLYSWLEKNESLVQLFTDNNSGFISTLLGNECQEFPGLVPLSFDPKFRDSLVGLCNLLIGYGYYKGWEDKSVEGLIKE
jgi:hypothetical protein